MATNDKDSRIRTLTNGSGSGRPKNIRIQIRNTGFFNVLYAVPEMVANDKFFSCLGLLPIFYSVEWIWNERIVCFPVATNDKDSLPDDSFFEQLMKMQGTRIEDQRSSLPGKGDPVHECCGQCFADPDRHRRCRSGFSCGKFTDNVFKLNNIILIPNFFSMLLYGIYLVRLSRPVFRNH